MILMGTLLIILRKDLFLNALLSGILMMLVSMPTLYYSSMLLSPGWIEKIWLWNNLSGIRITGIPIEDLVFYFLMGFIIGPFYEYSRGAKLVSLKK